MQSIQQRFEVNLSDVPGPGAYDEKVSNAFSSLQSRTTSLRRNPFNQTSARFDKSEFKSRYAPGPGQYRIPAFTDESFRRALIEHGRKPPFNVAAVRRYTLVRKDQPDMPGMIMLCTMQIASLISSSRAGVIRYQSGTVQA